MNSDPETEDVESELDDQRTSERVIEQQLDDFRMKWQREIQQRTVYGHVIADEQQQEQKLDTEEQARDFFQRASDLEREGKLYDAIKYYRAAMQLVPDIEFRMHTKSQQQATTTIDQTGQRPETTHDTTDSVALVDSEQPLDVSLQGLTMDDDELSTICVKNFPQQTAHISTLPSEVFIYILRWVVSSDLDVRSLEQCARVCRGFYMCARDPQLWKMICSQIWNVQTDQRSTNTNWRYMFINRPHILFNGVYISRTTYIRQGEQSLDAFYSPWHLVEYYRYVRFFPDDIVLIYTSAEEPRNIVGRLKSRSSARDPSLIQGTYRLQNDRILIMAKRAAQRSSTGVNTQRRNARDAPSSDIEQTIHMEFEICDAGKKKHQQLMWTHYSIKFVNKRTGEERPTSLDVSNDRHAYPSLVFSRVKSYSLAAEQPLQ